MVKLEGRNPGGSVKDRVALSMVEEAEKRRQLGPGPAGPGAHRADLGQHRDRPGARVPGQGLPAEGGPSGQRVRGAPPAADALGRRDHRVARDRGLQRSRPQGPGPRRRAPRMGLLVPVRQPGQPEGPLRGDRARDLAGLSRGHPLRRRSGNVGHAARCRAVPEGAEPGRPDLGGRAAGRGDGRRAAQPRRGLHPPDLRGARGSGSPRPQDRGAAPRVDRVDPTAGRRRPVRRASRRARRWPARPGAPARSPTTTTP